MEKADKLIRAGDLFTAVCNDTSIRGSAFAAIRRHIDAAPAVEAEEVVPCKDCKHAIVHPFMAGSQKLVCTTPVNWRAVEPGHFCSYGEGRDNA